MRRDLIAPTLADEAFLRRRGHELAGARKQRAAAKGSATARARAVLGIEKPVIGSETAVKPDGMVEARKHQRRVKDEAAMRDQRSIEQGEIRGISQHTLIEREVVPECCPWP